MAKTTLLGYDDITGLPVRLSDEARRLSTYVFGIKGMGKSTLLERIATQDMRSGTGLCYIDPHGDSADLLLNNLPPQRAKDVIFWDIADTKPPFGLNPFYCASEDDVERVAEEFVPAIEGLEEFRIAFTNAPRIREILANVAYTFVLNQGYTLAEVPKFLDNPDYRKRFYSALEGHYSQVKEFWERYDKREGSIPTQDFDSSLNKLRRFQRSRTMRCIFGQPTNSIDIPEAMDTGKIIIVKFSDIGEGNAEFVGAFVILELWRAILSRRNIPQKKRRPFHIIADEFYTYMTSAFYKIQDQGRKAGVDVVIAHQHRSQLHEIEMQGSTRAVGNKILFRVSGDDGKDFAREFKQNVPPPPTRQQLKNALVSNLLDHLSTRGHTDTSILAQRSDLQGVIERVFGYALEHHGQETALVAKMRRVPEDTRQSGATVRTKIDTLPQPVVVAYAPKAQLARSQLEGGLNELLFAAMTAQSETEMIALWQPDGISNQKFSALVDDIYVCLFSHVDRQSVARLRARASVVVQSPVGATAETPAVLLYAVQRADSFIWHRTQLLWEWENDLCRTIVQLGYALWKQPCYDRSGQLEEVTERPQSRSDIEAELANTLSNLPRYWAHVTVTEDAKDTEPSVATIKTLSPLKSTKASREQGQKVLEWSREDYGRDRTEVEAAIQRRLSGEGPIQSIRIVPDADLPLSPPQKKKRTIVLIE